MFVFAHVFFGSLIGLGFWHLSGDHRAVPVSILGAVLPDLLDKSLALLIPGIFGSGRTIGHSLIFLGIALALGLLIWLFRNSILGVACACALYSHQLIDSMWTLPASWFYPLLGSFPVVSIPDYIWHYFWLEISCPSEWIFAGASVIILGVWYRSIPGNRISLTPGVMDAARGTLVVLLAIVGIYLLGYGMADLPQAIFAPAYDPVTDGMAGLLALSGMCVLVMWPRSFGRA